MLQHRRAHGRTEGPYSWHPGPGVLRTGSLASAVIGRRGREPGATRLTPELRRALGWWWAFLENAVPRQVRVGPAAPPLLVWTDGAHELLDEFPTTCGAVLYDPADGALLYFGFVVQDDVREVWQVVCPGASTREAGRPSLPP